MPDEEAPPPPARPRRRRRWIILGIALLVVVVAFLVGVVPRRRNANTVRTETDQNAVPYVTVVRPTREAPARVIVLPGNAQAFIDSSIFARTSGYLKQWYVDIGARVKKGQLLAVIAAPEVDQQLEQARGTLALSEANLRLSETTAKRYGELRKSNAVSQQELDNFVGQLKANQASVEASRALVGQLEALQGFEKVIAPFDGVITVRNTDVGDLITAGSSTSPLSELFHIVQADKLRVYVSVPEAFAKTMTPGLTAELTLAAVPGQRLTGKLVRTAKAIDPLTRTLLVEIMVDNPSGTLFSGSYAAVTLSAPSPIEVFILPVETLLFRKEGLHVATVSNDQIVMKTIQVGHDLGDRIEVVQGLDGNELVVANPSDSIANGQRVRIARPAAPQPPKPGAPQPPTPQELPAPQPPKRPALGAND
jgi:RND family efflux transporter MFP subunit